ncbi:MAG TPA: hypothetical protein VFV01_41420 [Spirillospora sp.]|nr:hypothetical protein [Spirillospora sp.]
MEPSRIYKEVPVPQRPPEIYTREVQIPQPPPQGGGDSAGPGVSPRLFVIVFAVAAGAVVAVIILVTVLVVQPSSSTEAKPSPTQGEPTESPVPAPPPTTPADVSPGPTETGASGGGSTAPGQQEPLFAKSPLSIPPQTNVCNGNFDSVDLDEPRINPADTQALDGGPCMTDDNRNVWNTSNQVSTNPKTLDTQGCRDALRSDPSNPDFPLKAGQNFCEETSAHNIALVHVVNAARDGSAKLEVTTWSGQGEGQ